MSQIKVELNGKIYSMSDSELTKMLNKTAEIKNELKELAIYCIRKTNVAVMLNQVYATELELQADIKYYRTNGFRVCYTNGKS